MHLGGNIHSCMIKSGELANVSILCMLLKYIYCTCMKVKQLEINNLFNFFISVIEILEITDRLTGYSV